jgi:hypothetical protein
MPRWARHPSCMSTSEPRPSLGDQRHHHGGQVANDGAGALLQESGRGPLLEAPLGTESWQAAPHLGWISDTSLTSGQGLSGQRGVLADENGAIIRLRTRSQPRGGDLEAPEVSGAKERLLPEPRGVEGRAAQGQRALETQERYHPRLHQTTGI